MPAPFPLPKYIYKILTSAPPDPLPANLPLSDLDAKDAFIHLSTAKQTPGTVNRFFSTINVLWILKIELGRVESNVRWEDSGSDCFAHVYGPMPGKEEIIDVRQFRKGEGEDWGVVLGRDRWLV